MCVSVSTRVCRQPLHLAPRLTADDKADLQVCGCVTELFPSRDSPSPKIFFRNRYFYYFYFLYNNNNNNMLLIYIF